MTEYIERANAVRTVLEKPDMTQDEKAGVVRRLQALPAADVVEVVRCRECVHCCGVSGEPPFEDADEAYCDEHDFCVSETYFCADGERKDGGQDDGT